ncbi:MAG: hypothetical protein Q7J73_07595 [Dehalococcoidales bacterium]|nr:hypothetical protein [Dehalococcoidales bacterium]
MKALKITGIVIGSVVGLVVITAAAIFILMGRPSGISSRMTNVVSSPEAAKTFDTKWDNFNNSINAAPAGTTVTMNLTQEEVTSKINEEIKTVQLPEGLTMGNVTVNLVDGKLMLSSDVKYSALQGNAGMELQIETVNGTPSLVVKDIDMGMLPIPQALKDKLTDMIPANGVIGLNDLPIDITGIQIINGKIVMAGIKK